MKWSSLLVWTVLWGCTPPGAAPPFDAPREVATSNDRPQRDVFGGGNDGCDNGAHVDCFWHLPTCRDGVVRIPLNRPIPYCTGEEAREAFYRGVCEEMAGLYPCPSGRCATLNPRLVACLERYSPNRAGIDGFCEGTVRGEGESCASSRQCFAPTVDPEVALRCDRDAGRCVRAARADDAAAVGAECTEDVDCARGTVCAQNGNCRWQCAAVVDGGIAFDAAISAPDGS